MKYRSTLFDEARNKIGSAVASKNRNGNYFRNLVIPSNPKTAAQSEVRNRFTAHSQAWRSLTEVQRQGWTSLAKQVTLRDTLGNSYNPTGQQLYVSCNSKNQLVGNATVANAPGAPDPVPNLSDLQIVATVQTAAPHTHTLTEIVSGNGSNISLVIFATAQFSAGRSFVGPSQYRVLAFDGLPQNTAINLTEVYEGMFGPLIVGSKLSVQVKAITINGFASQPLRGDVVVTAV